MDERTSSSKIVGLGESFAVVIRENIQDTPERLIVTTIGASAVATLCVLPNFHSVPVDLITEQFRSCLLILCKEYGLSVANIDGGRSTPPIRN